MDTIGFSKPLGPLKVDLKSNLKSIFMSFDGTEGGVITLAAAADLTANYRATISSGDRIAHYFGKDIIRDILDQEGCMGIRIYYGLDTSGKKELVLVGVNADENDMVSGVVADYAFPCPTRCSSANDLNS